MKQHQTNSFISRAAAMLLTVIMAFAGAQTAGAQNTCDVKFYISGEGTVELQSEEEWLEVTNGEYIDCIFPSVNVLTLTPETGYYVSSVTYEAIDGLRIDLFQSDDFQWDFNIYSYEGSDTPTITVYIVFDKGLAGGADEASAVALTSVADLSHLAGGWYKVESDLTLGHTVNLHGDTHIIIASGATLTVNTSDASDEYGIYGSPLTVSGEGTLNVSANQSAIYVYNYTQTGCAVTLSGSYYGLNAKNNVSISGGSLTTSGADYGISTDNEAITISGGTVSSSGKECGLFAARAMNITGGTVSASGDNYGIRGYSVSITGGQVTVSSGGIRSIFGDITLGWTSATDYITASGFTVKEGKHVKIADGQKLYGGGFPSASYTGTIGDPSALNGLMLRPTAAVTKSGTNEYTIWNAAGWDAFCDALLDNDTYNRFSGKTVKLGADITVSRMAGADYHEFCGTFDGDGHTLTFNYGTSGSYASDEYAAPFHYVSNVGSTAAAFRNLHVAGHIYTSAKYAAGLIAQHWGTVNVENCRVSTVIHSSVSGDGTHGGFEAECKGVLNITGCVFDGKLLATGTTATDNCGGFVGWHNGGTTNISNSLYAPAAIATGEREAGPGTAGQNPSATFGRNAVNSIANSYYTRTLGTAQGKQAHSITASGNATLVHAGVATEYSVSGITAYKSGDDFTSGILYDNVLYAGSGDAVSLTLANTRDDEPLGYRYTYAFSGGTADEYEYSADYGETSYHLTMPDQDVTVNVDTETLRSTGQAVSVSYVDAGGQPASHDAIALDGTETTLGQNNQETWYYVGTDITVNSRINLTGDMNLILADGYTLDVKGIYIPQGSTLTIYAQSDGENAGRIVSHPTSGAAIGGMTGSDNGNIVICGGSIEATGYDHCAGIGSAKDGDGGSITIYGGTVTAKGGKDGAAIGGGQYCSGGTITIYGGTITANGSTDSDTCENGAGIGGGDCADGGTITIYGGTITTYSRDGAGIGGGDDGDGGTITINGGTITSNKVDRGQGARIGGGGDAAPGTITINGGTITTEGGSGAGIGGGKRNLANGTVTINGGVINASGSYGIGAGQEGADVAITLGWTSTDDRITASTYGGTVTIADGKSFHNGSEVLEPGTVAASDYESKLNGKTLIGVDVLQDDAANDVAALATRLGGKQTNIALSGRKLWKDGAWNTLCLPFALGDDQAASGHELDGTPLEGATLMTLGNSQACNTGFDPQTGTLNLDFLPATTVEPGVAYIVKWSIPDGMTDEEFAAAYAANPDAYDLKNPIFTGVTVTNDNPADHATTSLDGYVTFIGTYSPAAIYTDPATALYLGAANKLYWPTSAKDINSFRAYFQLNNGLTCGDPVSGGGEQGGPIPVRAITLNFGDGSEAQGIVSISKESGQGNNPEFLNSLDYYTLDGRRLVGQPTKKGLYIHGGKKVVIK